MNSAETFVQEFSTNFRFLQGAKIVIYGIGVNTALVLKELPKMDIIGLLDRDIKNIGKTILGKKVISLEEAMDAEAIIIITQDPYYWEIIYRRIFEECEKHQVPVYYPNGQRANIGQAVSDIAEDDYWDKTLAKMKEKIDWAETVSFDIFDTLIMRKVYYPETVFSLVELQYIQKFGKKIDFARIRKYAQTELEQSGAIAPTYEEIYQYIQKKLGLSAKETEFLSEQEISLEEKLLLPRRGMAELLEYARNKKKNVYLISDMYFGKEQIKRFLQLCGMDGELNLLISSEEKAKKSDGTLWDAYIRKVSGSRLLHFGDNEQADVEQAAKRGILAEKICSAREMLEKSSLKELASDICSVQEEVAAGLIIAKLFDDPFALSKTRGMVEWNSHEILGYAVYATPVYNYLVWLMKNAKEEEMDDILFFARDGYMLEKIYSYIGERFGYEDIPKGRYFLISRMLGVIWGIYEEKDIEDILKIRCFGKFGDLMKYRFFVQVDDCHADEEIYTDVEFDKMMSYITPYKNEILKVAEEQRIRYIRYIESLALGKFCISDPGYNGTGQFYLSQLLKKNFMGYYMYANLDPDENPYGQASWMKALYQSQEDDKAERSFLKKNSVQMENGFLVAPEGCCIGLWEDGTFAKTPDGMTQKTFCFKEQMLEGVKEYIDDMSICYQGLQLEHLPYVSLFGDKMFGAMMGSNCKIPDHIKDTFFVDTYFYTIFERKMWD